MTISVLIVDDSAVVREILSQILESAPDIKLLGAVADPILAMNRMKLEWPQVILLDVEMPRMDGLTFLTQLMEERPTPVVMFSGQSERNTRIAVDALAAGALSFVAKPTSADPARFRATALDLRQHIRAAAQAHAKRPLLKPAPAPKAPQRSADSLLAPSAERPNLMGSANVVAMGASTGGTQALEQLLVKLSPQCPGIVIVQHMPPGFTASFAQRLDSICAIQVLEAKPGDQVRPGRALIAPGGKHMMLKREGRGYVVDVREGPAVSRHCPSIDVLFRSAANAAGPNAVGIILTGMGDDGARGLREMFDTGARTLAQDEASCVVFGMPKEAIQHEGVTQVQSLDEIGNSLTAMRA